jgi:erythromycin esterase
MHALRAAIGDARVVLLGESHHGAGSAFAWRAATVEMLHRELGFDHVVVESSFYDCRRAYLEALDHGDAVRLGRECAFDIWAEAVEADPLWRAVIDSADSEHSLRLWGMDPQLSGDVAGWLVADLDALSGALLGSHDNEVLRRTLDAIRDDDIRRTPELRERGRQLLESLQRTLESQPPSWRPPSESRAFWRHTIESLIATEEDYWLYQLADGEIDSTQHNLRERQMATNLLYLLETHPDDRFVVWLHNIHASRNLQAIGLVDHGDHSHDFRQSVTLGDLLTDALDSDPLIVATLSARGSWAIANRDAAGDVPQQPPGGITHRLADAGIERALIDLRIAPQTWNWLAEPLAAPILGVEATTARWPDHVDVLLFDREMTPATTRL